MREYTPIKWAELDENGYLEKAEMQIWLSAFAADNPRAPAHKETDAAYDDARRRGKPWLYKRAWNRAYRSAGYDPSENDIAGEQPQEAGA